MFDVSASFLNFKTCLLQSMEVLLFDELLLRSKVKKLKKHYDHIRSTSIKNAPRGAVKGYYDQKVKKHYDHIRSTSIKNAPRGA